MFEIPKDVINFFFNEIRRKGKYEIILENDTAIIRPRLEEEYYKPIIIVKNLEELENSLKNYILSLNNFFTTNNNLQEYHDLSYFFNNLLFNMSTSDALDLTSYINKRSYFFNNNQFAEFDEPKIIANIDEADIYVQRIVEAPGLETPYILAFSMIIDKKSYQLPLLRYAFDENNTCYIFAIQFGKNRTADFQDEDYKKIINSINKGIKQYRNVSPSFVVVFSLFLNLLKNQGIDKIVIPDYLFCRYKNYYKSQTTYKSDLILTRILNNFMTLIQRMEYQYPFFEIKNYPNEIDSYTHINLNYTSENNKHLIKFKK